jgi:ABC-type branched-subunit amino acid transport system permease subunit
MSVDTSFLVSGQSLMLGFVGIVSFAHTMLFGIGIWPTTIAVTWINLLTHF